MKHTFDVELARAYGVNAAIILEHIGFWVRKNEEQGKHFLDGNYWTFQTLKGFREVFPYLGEKQISIALKKLEDAGLIVSGNYNKFVFDRTKWYALTENGKSLLQYENIESDETHSPISPKCQMGKSIMANGIPQNAGPIPDIYTDITTDTNTDNYTTHKKQKKEIRHKHGEYKNVLLSDEDMQKLKTEFPYDYQDRIERLSEYMASTGKSYRNHLATIRAWAKKENSVNRGKKPEEKPVERQQGPIEVLNGLIEVW